MKPVTLYFTLSVTIGDGIDAKTAAIDFGISKHSLARIVHNREELVQTELRDAGWTLIEKIEEIQNENPKA